MTARGILAGTAWVAAAVLLGGCGEQADVTDGSSERPTAATPDSDPAYGADTGRTTEPAGGPRCDSVWVAARKLPAGYDGCYAEGKLVEAVRTPCSFGRPLITYGNRFYAVPTGTIHRVRGPLDEDRGYRSAMKSCMA